MLSAIFSNCGDIKGVMWVVTFVTLWGSYVSCNIDDIMGSYVGCNIDDIIGELCGL